ncbi:hypothetical protein TD95_002062 [Thielaviopsis punctulata]|uniref:Urease accessory protein UreD n=1 Tax=Thielaviopsis punctulata TaxID=72032 RepID=A0A0F4ZFF0_9PEZI|nr:hypothetical protein TD95_002062 [Thielaviopsis punctulata]
MSPFPPSVKTPGQGRIVARRVPEGLTTVEVMSFRYPLKMIAPAAFVSHKSAIVFILSYGGGLVGGDSVSIDMLVRCDSRLCLLTQGYTKVFGSDRPDKITRQRFDIVVEANGALCLLPDPVQPYAASIYEQTQVFTVDASSDLCILDWVSQGRVALGENWHLRKWIGTNEIWLSESPANSSARLLVRDTVILDASTARLSGMPLAQTMYSLGVFGTLLIRGPHMQKLAGFFIQEFEATPRIGARTWGDEAPPSSSSSNSDASNDLAWRLQRLSLEKKTNVTWSAARLRGCVVVKFGASTVHGAKSWLVSMLARDGTVENMFGENAMYCLR